MRDAADVLTRYGYDVHGNLTSVLGPAAGVTRTWLRNGWGAALSDTQPEAGITTNVYDAAGNQTQTTDANSQVTTFTNDTDNRLVSRNAPGTVDDLTVTYNAAGRVTALVGGSTTTTFAYDSKGRLASRSDLTGGTTFSSSQTYDVDDQLVSVVYPSARTVAYEHDIEQRLTAIRQNGALFAAHLHVRRRGTAIGVYNGCRRPHIHLRPCRPPRAHLVVQCGRCA